MIPSDYQTADGATRYFDLDAVKEVVRGYSAKQPGWTSIVVYYPKDDVFIELRSSPPDIRGNSKDEAEEITYEYIMEAYGLDEDKVEMVRSHPDSWRLIDLR